MSGVWVRIAGRPCGWWWRTVCGLLGHRWYACEDSCCDGREWCRRCTGPRPPAVSAVREDRAIRAEATVQQLRDAAHYAPCGCAYRSDVFAGEVVALVGLNCSQHEPGRRYSIAALAAASAATGEKP